MIASRTLLLTAVAFMSAACNDSSPAAAGHGAESALLTAATLGTQTILPTADYLKLPRYENADIDYGRKLAMQCLACHSWVEGAPGPLGPNLHGMFGRPAGSVDGYPYSPALGGADFIWTPRALDAWLAQPARFLPGNGMAYAGLADQEDRDAIIAALLRLTGPADEAEGG